MNRPGRAGAAAVTALVLLAAGAAAAILTARAVPSAEPVRSTARLAFAMSAHGRLDAVVPGHGPTALDTGAGIRQPHGRAGALVFVTDVAEPGEGPDSLLWYRVGDRPPRRLATANAISHPVLSPDGTGVAFVADRSAQAGNLDIWVVDLDSGSISRVTDGPAADTWPSWSPDGSRIAFGSNRDDPDGDIYTVAVVSGPATRITATAGPDAEPAWSPDGTRIAFTTGRFGSSDVVTTAVGATTPTVGPSAGTGDTGGPVPAGWESSEPAWSPDGGRLAFTSRRVDAGGDIHLVPAAGGEPVPVAGGPGAATEPTWYHPDTGPEQVVYTTAAATRQTDLWSAAGTGAHRRALTATNAWYEESPAYSPDGTRLAYVQRDQPGGDGDGEIIIAAADGRRGRPLLRERPAGADDTDPAWSPDGRYVVFTRDAGESGAELRFADVATGADVTVPTASPRLTGGYRQPAWSPASPDTLAVIRHFAGGEGPGVGADRIWLMRVALVDGRWTIAGGDELRRGPATDAPCATADWPDDEAGPAWSPDGSRLAYVRRGRDNVPDSGAGRPADRLCVVAADGTGGRELVSPDAAGGGDGDMDDPAWSPDGSQVAFGWVRRCGDGPCWSEIWGVPVDPAPSAATGPFPVITGSDRIDAGEPAFAPEIPAVVGLTVAVAPAPGYVGGDELAVTVTVRNGLPRPVGAAWSTATLPAPLLVTGGDPECTPDGGCWFGILAAGESASRTVRVASTAAVVGVVTGRLWYDPVPGRTAQVLAQAPVQVNQPVLTIGPLVGPPGFVPLATGVTFPPGAVLRLTWDRGISAPTEVVVDGTGRFSAPVLVFPKDQLGPRRLSARWVRAGTRFGDVPAATPFLVVARAQVPPRFVGRG